MSDNLQKSNLGNCMESDTVVPIFTKSATVESKMDAAIDMYYFTASPPSRAVLLLARALGLALNLKLVNIMAGEQMQPDFLKMNPTHTVPTMNDNGFILWESRPIMQYLVDQYDKQGKLTFKDPKQQATINLMLYFDSGTLFQRLVSYFAPVMMGAEKPNEEKKGKVEEALQTFDKLLENKEWAAGDRMSIADFSLIASVSTAEAVQIDVSKHAHVMAWYERTKKALAPMGYEEINQKGADMFAQAFKARAESS